jgi:type III pantothenate kinase
MKSSLFVRIGNSSVEFSSKSGEIIRSAVGDWSKLIQSIKRRKIDRVFVASVNPPMTKALKKNCQRLKVSVVEIRSQDVLLKSPYKNTLGVDRILNVFALNQRFKTSFILVDLGTATTVEFFDSKRGYLGGWIAPGAWMLSEALRQNTALLPSVDVKMMKSLKGVVGSDTQQTLLLGIRAMIKGLISEAERTARQICGTRPIRRFITGGGAVDLGRLEGWKHVSGLQLEALRKIADNK